MSDSGLGAWPYGRPTSFRRRSLFLRDRDSFHGGQHLDETHRFSSSDECFSFAREGHADHCMKKMESLLKSMSLTDVVLVAGLRYICNFYHLLHLFHYYFQGPKSIPAHRLVLSAASDYFAAMFTNDVRESNQNEVVMRDIDPEALYILVNYCYTGKLELQEDNVESLLSTACLLQLPEAVEACSQFLIKQLHPSNCLGIRHFADSQFCAELYKISHSYTTEHFMDVIGNQEFLLLPSEEVEKLLASDDLNVPNEEVIFQALMLWLRHDLPSRKKDLGRLLSLVKLPLLSPQFIADHIEANPVFKEDRVCQELIVEALKYHVLPERRFTLQSFRTRPRKSTVGFLYLVGGMDSNKGAVSMDRYDLRQNTWSSFANLSGRRLQFGAAVLDSRLLVVGGRDGLKTLNSVECFDQATKIWSSLPPMATHRHGLGVAVLDGPSLYAVGGHDGWSYLNTVERWDPVSRQWSFVAPMSTARSTAGVAALNGKLYAVGGRDGSSCLRTVESYNPHTNRWAPVAPMSRKRGGVGVAVLNGYLYALGGHDAPASNPSASRFDCIERYDPSTDTWTTVASMSVGREAVAVCVLGDRLIAIGGYDGQQYLSLAEAYDPQTNEWQPIAPLLNGRAGACVAVMKH